MGRAKHFGDAKINKGRMKGGDPEIDTAHTPKRFGGRLALQEKIRKTFANSIPNNNRFELTCEPTQLMLLHYKIRPCYVAG